MQNGNTNESITVLTPALAQVGWSAKTLRIGRVQLEFVKVHDSFGAHHFGSFIAATLEGTKRHRSSKLATRYLEHLSHTTPARLLSEEAADYIKDMQRRELSASSLYSQTHQFRMLMLACGDIPVSQITSQHIRDLWDVLRWWPKNVGHDRRFQGLTDAEILAIGRAEPTTPPARATLELANRQIAAFFNRLLRMRVIATSPLAGFGTIKKSLVEVTTRRNFTEQEVADLFSAERFLPWARKTPHAWWGPLIGLFTGARVGEVAQLKVEDVVEKSGMWCFHFRITADANGSVTQSLKGLSSVRIVPIPTQLIELGFLDFLEDVKACGHPRLFPQLARGVCRTTGKANGATYGAVLSQQFAGYVKKNFPAIEKGLAFHGFRHTFATTLRSAGISVELIASITGHSKDKAKFPVLEQHYLHVSSHQWRQDQLDALNTFRPQLAVPKYLRGQFARALGPNGKKHP